VAKTQAFWYEGCMELLLPSEDQGVDLGLADRISRLTVPEVVQELAQILGLRRTALIGGVKETRRVHEWIKGEREPHRQDALRAALQSACVIATADGPSVAKAWFTGSNPPFGHNAPILVMRDGAIEDYYKVVRAAYAFAGHSNVA
jgi:hypothetical protein